MNTISYGHLSRGFLLVNLIMSMAFLPVTSQPGNMKLLWQLSQVTYYLKQGQAEASLQVFTDIEHPHYLLYILQSIALIETKQYSQAEQALNLALEDIEASKIVFLYSLRGSLRLSGRSLELAKQDFEQVLSRQPQNQQAHYAMALIQQQQWQQTHKSTAQERLDFVQHLQQASMEAQETSHTLALWIANQHLYVLLGYEKS